MNPRVFDVFPAIDILQGACVRLLRGDYDAKTEYGQHPRSMAERWLGYGTRWLHVVDLDGAKEGTTVNYTAIKEVIGAATEVGASVQVGGGIRTFETIDRWLEAGAARCVIGTAALDTAWMEEAVGRFGGDKFIVGLDGRDGKIAVRGWLEQTDVQMVEVAERLVKMGVSYALVTDVDRDGTLQGANVELAREIQDQSGIGAIASGGVRNVKDVEAAKTAGLAGVILGRALYDGTLDLADAIALT